MKLTKGNILLIAIVGLIIITALSLLVKDYVIPVVLFFGALLGWKQQNDPVSKKIREQEAQGDQRINQVKQEMAETKATEEDINKRIESAQSATAARRSGTLLILIFIFISYGSSWAASGLFIPKDYETLKEYYIQADQEVTERDAIIKDLQAVSAAKDKQITDLMAACNNYKSALAEATTKITDQAAKLTAQNNRWGLNLGANTDLDWTIGITRKTGLWGWNINASPAGKISGSAIWWLP